MASQEHETASGQPDGSSVTPVPPPSLNPDRERLKQHFQSAGLESHTTAWDDLWKEGFLPWDRGRPNPALVDILNDRKDVLSDPWAQSVTTGLKRRKRALVPGCGRGYDVLLFASYGYDTYGLDTSEKALEECKKYLEEHGHEYTANDPEIGSGNIAFLSGDFFSSDWEQQIDGGLENGFEVIYDYTFLSALSPKLRPEWALRMSKLLSPVPDANLICVEFPTYKEPSSGGPPWALPPIVYEQHLMLPGENIEYDKDGAIVPAASRKNEHTLVRFDHWQPERTHEAGKGTDWVSVWRHSE